jgi:hypothetical protein
LGPMLYKYSMPYYNVIREKLNVRFSFRISSTLIVSFFE